MLDSEDAFLEGHSEKYYNEWEALKQIVKKAKNGNIEARRIIEEKKRDYLNVIQNYTYDEREYQFYKIMLEYLGIDEYVYEVTREELNAKLR